MLSADVLQRAQQWIQRDPNPTTAKYVQDLINSASSSSSDDSQTSEQELSRLFPPTRLQFGTAGLRSCMQPGPVGMNDLVVLQTAQGLAKYVIEQHETTTTTKNNDDNKHNHHLCAVVGYDHRSSSPSKPFDVSSLSFAIITALVFMEAGIECFLMDGLVATPLVPYGVLRYIPETKGAAATTTTSPMATVGVMITASHNPAQDAGYKVYWTDGCQIRSPIDAGIAAAIQDNLEPWTDYQKLYQERKTRFPNDPCLGLSRPQETKQLVASYFKAIARSGLVTGQAAKFQSSSSSSSSRMPKFCYTAMHGVGHPFAQQSFANFGLPEFVSVPEQQQPDPTFPTVSFPNPEEKGALDLAKQFAVTKGCHLILANDPDADRLAVSEYNPNTRTWNDLTGDQIGVLLGHWLWTQFKDTTNEDGAVLPVSMCSSTVSSQMLATMARQEGFHYEDTLTGFKWIGSKAATLSESGKYRQVFCYEEAIGYCCGDVIFDKDGLTACAVMAELAIHVYCQQEQTLMEHIASLYQRYGEFVSNNGYFVLEGDDSSSVVSAIMNRITQGGKFDQTHVGPYEIASIRYLGEPGYDSTTKDHKPLLPTSQSSPMVTIRFSNGGVAQFRSSGTEPKFKYYCELPGKPGVDRKTVETELTVWSETILEELLQPSKHGLKRPSARMV